MIRLVSKYASVFTYNKMYVSRILEIRLGQSVKQTFLEDS
jgi:hypothetical protein